MKPYYQDDSVTIYHGDCREILPTLSGIDLIFTSPPYNLGNTSGGGFPAARMGHYTQDAPLGAKRGGMGKWQAASRNGGLSAGYDEYNDSMPHAEYVAWQHDMLRLCWQSLTPTGAIYYNHKPRIFDGRLVTPLDYVPHELQQQVRQVVIWARAGGINFSPAFYVPTHEWVTIIAKPAFRLKSKGASGVGDVWRIPQEANPLHPAPFPLALPLRAIETTPASVILDPFAGSGTTLRAAKDLGRRAIGIEKSERYCEIAARRMSQAVLPLATAD